MILSNKDIVRALQEKRLIIDPLPQDDQIDSTSIDLRMGKPLWVWDPGLERSPKRLRVAVDELDFKDLSEKHLVAVQREDTGRYLIRPQTVYLVSTHEKIQLPSGSRLGGRIEGKSSLARLGLAIHMTAPMIHCGTGFGIITLEIYNHGPFALEVTPGVTRICQLIIEEVLSEPEERSGRIFSEQKDAKG